jgi:hypothetical protein
VAGCCEHSCSIKGGEFLDQLSDCRLLKKGSAPLAQLVSLFCEPNETHRRETLSAVSSYAFLKQVHRVQTGSGAHPASYPMGIKDSFPGGKAAGP